MSGDYSRLTYDPMRDFSAVLAQQGRVSADADANEGVGAALRRAQAESLDTLGWAAVPRETPDGFRIEATGGALTIGRGRIYVDGLLAENHGGAPLAWDRRLAERWGTAATPYTAQPYFPNPPALPAGPGPHLAYLKVWQREVTSIEDPRLIEPALGVDTTTRLQTAWQVRMLANVGNAVTCATRLDDISQFVAAEPAAGGRLSSGTAQVKPDPDPCHVPPASGYKGLENQLYRVEIHRGGTVGGPAGATFKWSRDNATVATRVTHIRTGATQLVVESVGRDEVLGFSDGDWVEVTDDVRELAGQPGEMRRIRIGNGVDPATQTITLTQALPAGMFPVDAQDRTVAARNTRVHRWDQAGRVLNGAGDLLVDLDAAGAAGTIPVTGPATSVLLEHGVVVTFELDPAGGTFRTGDWWCFAARTATGDIEILDRAPPRGVHAHYAKLAIVSFPDTETDCRVLFAPQDDQFTLYYVSGDTQQALDDPTNAAALALDRPLVVGVANGGWPVAGRQIHFHADSGNLSGAGADLTVTTGADGLASASWTLAAGARVQTAVARLLAHDGTPRGLPVRFSATLAQADRVAYRPDNCANLAGTTTVQAAIDRLCGLVGGGCDTLALSPGPGWVEALESFSTGTEVTVCFRPGTYVTERSVNVSRLDHIRLRGAGPGTIIVGDGVEAVLAFRECRSVHLADLSVMVDRFPSEPVRGQLGVVTFESCGRVELERVRLRCPPGVLQRSTCLTARSAVADVEGSPAITGLVRVRDCELSVGHGQTGVLVVNAERVAVTGCELHTPPLPEELDVRRLLADRVRLGRAAGQLVNNLVVDREQRVLRAGFNTAFTVGGFVVRLNSPVPEGEWNALVAANPPSPADVAEPNAVADYVQKLTSAATEPATLNLLPTFNRMVTGLAGRMGAAGGRFLQTAEGRMVVRTMLAGEEIDVKPAAEVVAVRRSVSVAAAGGAVRLDSPLSQQDWDRALTAAPPPRGASVAALATHIRSVAKRVLLEPAFANLVASQWIAGLVARNRAAAACGVRVAGTTVGDVLVRDNSFRSTLEAVHVAASFRQSGPFTVRSVRAHDNDIVLSVPFEVEAAPRAIFVGNADRIAVFDNRSRMAGGFALVGIHLEGRFGPHVVVRDNDVRSCRTGVLMVHHPTFPERVLWLIADNLALGADPVVQVPEQARDEGNVG